MTLAAGTALVYDGVVPLALEAVSSQPLPAQLAAINDSNDVLLTNVLLMNEKHESDEDDEVLDELRRQDHKLKLILDLLSLLLHQHNLLPAARPVRFSGEQLAVPVTEAADMQGGQLVKCSLYIDPALPKPLQIYATAREVFESEGEKWLLFDFTSLSAVVQDHLEKLVFRHHRKSVAQLKRH